MIRNVIGEGTIKEIVGEPKKLKRLNEVLGDIDLTEDEERFLIWLSGTDVWTVENFLSVLKKYNKEQGERI